MGSQSRNTILSGIEPVDELLGGLESGQLYLVHGEASGKSLFGIKFLIEGLKRGENGALVIRYSPEDAVRRFARLGYDCLEDVYSGRLVILEYSDDIIQKIGNLRELTPVLRELEWLLGETQPRRLMFDPVTSVLAGSEGNIESRAREFAEWARSFGATVVLIADESNHGIIRSFEPLVAESFRFDVRDTGEHITRFIAFEKSPETPDQAIEVDPSRGVFLLGRADATTEAHKTAPHPPSMAELESIREELRSARERIQKDEIEASSDIDLAGEEVVESKQPLAASNAVGRTFDSEPLGSLQTSRLTPPEEQELQSRPEVKSSALGPIEELVLTIDETAPPAAPTPPPSEGRFDELSDLLDDLSGNATPLDLDLPELQSAPPVAPEKPVEAPSQTGQREQPLSDSRIADSKAGSAIDEMTFSRGTAGPEKPTSPRHSRASDARIDSVITARAVELLLRPPQSSADFPLDHAAPPTTREWPAQQSSAETDVQAKDFNVLVVEDDPETCELLSQTLADYTLEVEHDGVSGLAKLISFKPDLVVLDFDLPVIDGFKVLTLIRSALNVPIIILSGSRMRAIDRVMAAELGADHYLTKPFSAKELKHKARQLIARYRGISKWIINPAGASRTATGEQASKPVASDRGLFIPYSDFAAEVEKKVKAAMEEGAPFSIVGCRLPHMTANGGRIALRLMEVSRELTRETDVMSTNPRNDLVIMLGDAAATGARAFAGRLRERVIEEFDQEPSLWMRSFPDLAESTEADATAHASSSGNTMDRRSSDEPRRTASPGNKKPERRSDPRDSYIDFLEHL